MAGQGRVSFKTLHRANQAIKTIKTIDFKARPGAAWRGLAGPGGAWRGLAGPGGAWRGLAWQGFFQTSSRVVAGQGEARLGSAWLVWAGRGMARHGKAWRGMAGHGKARVLQIALRGTARRGWAWLGTARLG